MSNLIQSNCERNAIQIYKHIKATGGKFYDHFYCARTNSIERTDRNWQLLSCPAGDKRAAT